MEKGLIQSGDFSLQFSVEGTGIPTLVIGSAVYYPRTFSENLRKHLRLYFVDHRGFGIAPKRALNPADYEFDVILEDIERARIALGLDQVVIVGHSGHGYMALEYAKKYPQHVSHVVMLAVPPSLSAETNALIEQYWQGSASDERKNAFEQGMKRLQAEQSKNLSPSQGFIRQYVCSAARIWYDYNFDSSPFWEGVDVNMEIFGYTWGTVFRDIDVTRNLELLDKPVFLGLGRYDYLAPPYLWSPLLPKFKDLTVRVFEQSGHTPQYEEAQLFDEELLNWLSEHSS